MTVPPASSKNVLEIIEWIMHRYGYRHQYQVAEFFGVTAQTLSGWVKTDSIPPKHLLKYKAEFGGETGGNLKMEPVLKIVQESAGEREIISTASSALSFLAFVYSYAKNLKILFWVPAVICSYSLFYLLFIATPVFTATAKILPTGEKGNTLSGLAGAAAQFGINIPISMGENISWNELYPELIKSQKLKRMLMEKKFSTKKYGKDKKLLSIIAAKEGLKNEPFDIQWKVALMVMDGMIQVHRSRLSPLVTLEITGFEPQFVADLAWAVIKESSSMQLALKTNKLSQKRKFIEDRIVEVKSALTAAETQLKEFREANRRMEKSPALLLQEDRLKRDVELQNSLYVSLQGQYENTRIKEVEESAMIQVIDDPIAPWTRTRPRRTRTMLLVGFGSLSLAFLIVYSKEFIFSEPDYDSITWPAVANELKGNIKSLFFFSRKSDKQF